MGEWSVGHLISGALKYYNTEGRITYNIQAEATNYYYYLFIRTYVQQKNNTYQITIDMTKTGTTSLHSTYIR